MLYRTDSLGLSGSVTAILRDLIHERLGLFYSPHQFDQVADRLAPRVVARGLNSFMDYYYVLKYSDESDEWLRVMDALAVHETYFWREIDQLRALVDHVVPQLAAAQRGGPLRIWSIPCATGEEPLTIAMLLEEAGWFGRLPIDIVASDASEHAVGRARQGVFTQRSFRNLPPALREKYFTGQPGGRPTHDGGAADVQQWQVAPSLQARISYDVVNLMDDERVARHAAVPIIVCRNVFIYFSDASIRRVLDVFERAMPSPGYLCMGAAESLLRRTTTFGLEEIGGAFMYVKHASGVEARPMAASGGQDPR